MAYGLTVVILLALLIAVQVSIRYRAQLVEREQQQRRTLESWREPAPDEDDTAEQEEPA